MLEPSRSASPSPQSPTLEGRQCGSPVSSLPAAVLLRRRVSLRRLLRTEYVSATPRRAVSPLHALVYPRSLLQSVSPSKAFRGGSEAGSPLWLGRLGRPCLGRVTDVTGTDSEKYIYRQNFNLDSTGTQQAGQVRNKKDSINRSCCATVA